MNSGTRRKRSPRVSRGREISCLQLFLFLLAAGAAAQPTIRFGECQHDYPTPGDAECGVLAVAENPADRTSRQIKLNIMRIPAVAVSPAEPLFVIVGGPGGAAVRSAPQYLPYFRGLQKSHDLIFVDQRGTGGSNGLDCPFEQIQVSALTDAARLARAESLAQQCVARISSNLAFYTTPYAVRDLEQVRQALGYAQVNLWGVSYGTRVVLEFMRSYPRSVRTAVLDGAAPVSIQLPEYVDRDASQALAQILSACTAQPACATAYGDLTRKWLDLLDRLDAQPRTVTLHHPRSQHEIQAHVSAATVSAWVQLALYSRELAPILPRALHLATNGDFALLANIALLATEELEETVSEGMQAAVLCAEDRRYARLYPNERENREGGGYLLRPDRAETVDRICEHFPVKRPPEEYFKPVESAIPTLILSGALDPVTPPMWGDRVGRHLGRSRHLVVPNVHHGVTMQGCLPRVVRRFVETADAAALDVSCTEKIAPAAFFIDGAGPGMAAGGLDD